MKKIYKIVLFLLLAVNSYALNSEDISAIQGQAQGRAVGEMYFFSEEHEKAKTNFFTNFFNNNAYDILKKRCNNIASRKNIKNKDTYLKFCNKAAIASYNYYKKNY